MAKIDTVKRPLSGKQLRFVGEYLIDLNATQAALRAGYSQKTAAVIGFENLQKPKIQVEIQKAMKEREDRVIVTQDMVLKELKLIAFSDMADFVRIDESGMIQANPLDTLPKHASRIIRKVKEKRVIKSTPEGDQVLDATYEFELYDKIKSLELIGRHLGMFLDKIPEGDDPPDVLAAKMREQARAMRERTDGV